MSSTGVLKIYPSNNEFVGEFSFHDDEDYGEASKTFQTIIILDRSTSMGSTVERVIKKILPIFFAKLSYRKWNQIFFITFERHTNLHVSVVADFPLMQIRFGSCTRMGPAVRKCKEIFEDLDSDKPVRVLTISDGEIQDQQETSAAANDLVAFLENKSFFINSKAVRLFTSDDQPDTTALCSLLQINNATPKSLADLEATQSDDFIATKMAELFMDDNFDKTKILRTTKKILRRKPWNSPVTKLLFTPGKNHFWISQMPEDFWISQMPEDGFKLNRMPLRVIMQQKLSDEQLKALMDSNSDLIVETMKVLKIVNSGESNQMLYKINQFFSTNTGRSALAAQASNITADQSVVRMKSSEKALYIARK